MLKNLPESLGYMGGSPGRYRTDEPAIIAQSRCHVTGKKA
jgi:hypothetical protein